MSEFNIRIKLLEDRIAENKKRVIELYCTPSNDFIRPAIVATEWADNVEGGVVVDPVVVEIIDGVHSSPYFSSVRRENLHFLQH